MSLVPFPGTSPVADEDPWGDTPAENDAAGARMSFLEHLDELRKRLVVCVAALGVGFLIAFAFIDRLYDFIMRPLAAMLRNPAAEALSKTDPNLLKQFTPDQIKVLKAMTASGGQLVYTEPTEAFILYLKIAMLAGVILAAPVILWQLWLFISPGLYRKEKKWAVPFVALSSTGFVAGAAFTHYLLFPWMWKFLAGFSTEYTLFLPKIDSIFSLYTKMLLGMGAVFQMPTLVFFLAKMRLVTARFLAKNFKYAILIIFVLAAVITPSGDMLTQSLFAAPMIGLYILSIFIAWVVAPRRPKAPAAD
ncbi:MAG: twin-arginine translocase subunit TatC [Bacteroidales bacterium]